MALLAIIFFSFATSISYAQYGQVNSYGNSDSYGQMVITTVRANNITTGSATLNALVNGINFYNSYTLNTWFEYGTTMNLGNFTARNYSNSGYTNFNTNIGGLKENTVYYFRAAAQGPQGIAYGGINTFKTNPVDIINIGNIQSDNTNSPATSPKRETKPTTVSQVEAPQPTASVSKTNSFLPITILGWLTLLILLLLLVLVIKNLHFKFSSQKTSRSQH